MTPPTKQRAFYIDVLKDEIVNAAVAMHEKEWGADDGREFFIAAGRLQIAITGYVVAMGTQYNNHIPRRAEELENEPG